MNDELKLSEEIWEAVVSREAGGGEDHPYGAWGGGSKASGGRMAAGGGGGKGDPEVGDGAHSMRAVKREDMNKDLAGANRGALHDAVGELSPGDKVTVTHYDKHSRSGKSELSTKHTLTGKVGRVDSKFPDNPLAVGMSIEAGSKTFYVDVAGMTTLKSAK